MTTLLRLLLLALVITLGSAGDVPVVTDGPKSRDGIGRYFMGREIAQVMGHQGAAWLERPERQAEEDTASVVQALELKQEWTVADIGCGTGYYSYRMAPLVQEVLGVEIQQEMLDLLMAAGRKKGITNVKPVLGTVSDPKLGVNSVDLILLVDVYHEFDHPVEMLTAMRAALKPDGRIALVEFKAEDPRIPIKPIHKLSEAQARKEFAALGFTWERTVSTLPWQHLIFFKR
jgi:SAM-dependent methyltransferase